MRWKWVLIGVLGLITAAVVAVYIILTNYNFNDLKPQIAQAVKDATGRDLTLGGDIKLKIGLTPALVVENASFQNAPWGSRPELAKVKRLEVAVALFPLLSRNIEIKRLILVEPDILLESDKSGKFNLAFEAAKKPEVLASKETPAKAPFKLPALTFEQIQLERARLTYQDGLSGKTFVLALDNFKADAPSMEGPVKLALKGAYNDKPFEVSGTLGPILGVMDPSKPWPLKVTAQAGGAAATVEGQITDLQNLKAIALVLNAQGSSIPEVANLWDAKDAPDVGPFKVMVKVSGSGEQPAVDALEVEVGTEDLARVKVTGSIKDPKGQKGMDLNFSVKGKDLANLQRLSGSETPLKGPFEISGKAADTGAKAYKVQDLKVVLPNMDLSGSAEVNLADKRPNLTAAFSSQKLDLRPFFPKEEGRAPKTAAKRDKVFLSDPLPLEGLKRADASLQIRAAQILMPQMALNNLVVDLVARDGALTLKPLKAGLREGTLEGHIDLRPKGKSAVLEAVLKVSKLDIGRMAKELQIDEEIEGIVDLDLDVKGQGGSVAELMAGLNGKSVLVMGKGRFDNQYIELLGADIGSSALRLINPFSQEEKYVEINCMVSGFDIKDGIANNTALVIDTNRMIVVGEGKVNLKTEELDISFKSSPKQGAGASGLGKVSLSLSDLTRPFKLGGTLANPSLAFDPTQAALSIGKSVGGMVLFGPLGIAAGLVSGSSGDEHPCIKALDAAKTGVEANEKGTAEKLMEGVTGGAKGAAEGVGRGLKKLFGK